jgi:hypothetical protein
LEELQVLAEHAGVGGEPLPQRAGGRAGCHRRLEQSRHHRPVVAHHAPRCGQVLAELSGVGEVVGRMAAVVERRPRLRVHVGQQCLQQFLLAGEVLVEGPGSAVRGRRDVGDLGVQVAPFGELAPRRRLERFLGLGRLGPAHSHNAQHTDTLFNEFRFTELRFDDRLTDRRPTCGQW